MSDCASVDFDVDFDADASDALLLWVDPLGADALDLTSSIDGFESQADKAAEPDSRPPESGFGGEPPRSEPGADLASVAAATRSGSAHLSLSAQAGDLAPSALRQILDFPPPSALRGGRKREVSSTSAKAPLPVGEGKTQSNPQEEVTP